VEKTKNGKRKPEEDRSEQYRDVLSVMIFVAAVTFAGWYVYSRGVTVAYTSAQNTSILANGSLSPTP
jgi:hypothetical protein